jgi:hypothetical protein
VGDWDQEEQVLRPAGANSSWDPISKMTRAKWTEGVAQAVEHLLCKDEALSSNPNPPSPAQKKDFLSGVLVAHTYNPSYLEGWDQEDHSLRPAQANSSRDSISKISEEKIDWRYSSSSGVPALQACSPDSNPSLTKKRGWLPLGWKV